MSRYRFRSTGSRNTPPAVESRHRWGRRRGHHVLDRWSSRGGSSVGPHDAKNRGEEDPMNAPIPSNPSPSATSPALAVLDGSTSPPSPRKPLFDEVGRRVKRTVEALARLDAARTARPNLTAAQDLAVVLAAVIHKRSTWSLKKWLMRFKLIPCAGLPVLRRHPSLRFGGDNAMKQWSGERSHDARFLTVCPSPQTLRSEADAAFSSPTTLGLSLTPPRRPDRRIEPGNSGSGRLPGPTR